MKQAIWKLGFGLCLGSLLYSCKSPMYIPSSINVPMVDTSGEVEARIGRRNANLNVAVTNHVIVGAQLQWLDKKARSWFDGDKDVQYNMRNVLLLPEISAGYFGKWMGYKFSIMAGCGMGPFRKSMTRSLGR